MAVHPNAGVSGYKVEGVLGAKVGVRSRRFGAFVKTVADSQLQPPQPVAGFTTRNRQWSVGVGKRF